MWIVHATSPVYGCAMHSLNLKCFTPSKMKQNVWDEMQGKSVLVYTLIHEWNVRAFHCTMNRLKDDDKNEKRMKWKNNNILFKSSTANSRNVIVICVWIVDVSSFSIFCVWSICSRPAGCVWLTYKQGEELAIFYPFIYLFNPQ